MPPVFNVRASRVLNDFGFVIGLNNGVPAPSTVGTMHNRYSSKRSRAIKLAERSALPKT